LDESVVREVLAHANVELSVAARVMPDVELPHEHDRDAVSGSFPLASVQVGGSATVKKLVVVPTAISNVCVTPGPINVLDSPIVQANTPTLPVLLALYLTCMIWSPAA
jgi:hypothetical protein